MCACVHKHTATQTQSRIELNWRCEKVSSAESSNWIKLSICWIRTKCDTRKRVLVALIETNDASLGGCITILRRNGRRWEAVLYAMNMDKGPSGEHRELRWKWINVHGCNGRSCNSVRTHYQLRWWTIRFLDGRETKTNRRVSLGKLIWEIRIKRRCAV